MSSQRFLWAIARRRTQEPSAFGTGTSIACQELMEAAGSRFPEAHLDAEWPVR
jgi:hypothetical protein